MIASKPGYQLHAQLIPFQSFANNQITEDEDVNDM